MIIILIPSGISHHTHRRGLCILTLNKCWASRSGKNLLCSSGGRSRAIQKTWTRRSPAERRSGTLPPASIFSQGGKDLLSIRPVLFIKGRLNESTSLSGQWCTYTVAVRSHSEHTMAALGFFFPSFRFNQIYTMRKWNWRLKVFLMVFHQSSSKNFRYSMCIHNKV